MKKEILVLKHIAIEGPGSIGEYLDDTHRPFRVIELTRERLDVKEISRAGAVISLGGPMNVYEEEKYPFLKDELALLERAVQNEIPVVGICLGAQLLARACGAKVKKAEEKEVGWYRASLTEAGRKDPLFKALPSELAVFQWHEDTFDIPTGGALLAVSQTCKNQAFRYGKNAYGLQFHLEVTADMIKSWIDEYVKEGLPALDTQKILADTGKYKDIYARQAAAVYKNLTGIFSR